ncbi:hypothetical protein OZ668_16690 [Elizabethkingia sp. HX XZB]|uniref:hypothetical protein n=1 Tax=Elizabethkingia sp. HX XZB TaxID=3003193 RepID=UPI002A2466AB|nr:hypothetical protein [Elizabethkingia sp. HX XZB]MDX8569638.1 hypothetical protein [Elizabethkingia sp. HX XZB]
MNNNQSSQTLFRFVSQRNAQLIESEEKITFINRSKAIKSVFDQAIIQWANQKAPGITKLDALTTKAKELKQTQQIQLFTKADEVSVVTGSFYKAGKQLAVESKISPELEAELKAYFSINANGEPELIPSAPLNLVNIWDNFIYQVVTQESFYVKEALSQVLKAYNYIKNIVPEGSNKEEVLKQAVDAKVVLPPVLFLDEYPVEQDHAFQVNVSNIGASYISAKSRAALIESSPQNIGFVNEETSKKSNYLAAAYYKENLLILKKELEKAKKSYDVIYNKAYKAALKKHNEIVQNTENSVQAVESVGFSFEHEISPLDDTFLSNKLSNNSLQTLVMLVGNEEPKNLSEVAFSTSDISISGQTLVSDEYQTLDEIIAMVEVQIDNYNQQINDNIIAPKEEYASIGGVLIPMGNNLQVATGNANFFTATTVAKNSTEWNVLLELSDKSLSIVSATYTTGSSSGMGSISDSSVQLVQNGVYRLFANNTIPVNSSGSNGFMINGEVMLSDNKVYPLSFTMILNSSGTKDLITNTYPYTGGGSFIDPGENPQTKIYKGRVCAEYNEAESRFVTVNATLDVPESVSIDLRRFRLMDGGNVVKVGYGVVFYVQTGNSIVFPDLFDNTLTLQELQRSTKIVLDFAVNGQFKQLVLEDFNSPKCVEGILKDVEEFEISSEGHVFIPKGFGIKRLGIADYLKVEQSTHAYVEGEVANIENIMAREYRDKSTRRLRRSENTTTTSKETEREKLTDTTTATRFEMQTEIARMLQEANDTSINASSEFKFGDTSRFNIASGYANHRAKEESTRQSITQAQDITERALDRVVSKVREERIEKIVEEFEENNSHGFDNRKGDKHVVGVYRWVDKLMKNQVFKYGKRLMFEFSIPQPAKLHNLAMQSTKQLKTIEKPIDPRLSTILTMQNYSSLSDENILKYWLNKYNVEIEKKPENEISVSKAISVSNAEITGEMTAKSDSIEVPDGYTTSGGWLNVNHFFQPDSFEWTHIGVTVGDVSKLVSEHNEHITINEAISFKKKYAKKVGIAFESSDTGGVTINVSLDCVLSKEVENEWLQRTFNEIIKAYEDAMVVYNQTIAEEETRAGEIKSKNPLFYRQIEQEVLRHNCIAYLVDDNSQKSLGQNMYMGQNMSEFGIKREYLDQYASLAKFMEQAFEWDIISYSYYPYYWGDRRDWESMYRSENIDPLFNSFLRSGMARVVVTVRPGFEDAVQFYMSTGKIWSGGEVPVIGDPLYLSIVDEMREPMGEKYGKAWITRIPTPLTILQAESIGLKVEHALPFTQEDPKDFEDPKALITESNFEKNDATMQAPESKMVGSMEINNDYLQLTTKDDPKQVVAQLSLDDLKEALQ